LVKIKKLIGLITLLVVLVGCSDGNNNNAPEKQLEKAQKELENAKEDTERLEEKLDEANETSDLIEDVQEEMGVENEENNSDDSDDPNETNEVEVLDESEVTELLEYSALGEGDSISSLTIEGREVNVVVEIADNDIFDDKSILAETVYSRAGDELLEYDEWEVLTIEFVDVGTVSLHKDERETNEYDKDYFPTEKIIEQLN